MLKFELKTITIINLSILGLGLSYIVCFLSCFKSAVPGATGRGSK